MPEEKSLSLLNTVEDTDKIRVVTEDGLSQSIEVGHLRNSLFINELSDEVSALETRANANDTDHDTMDSRLTSLESAVGEGGDEGFGLVKEISDVRSNLTTSINNTNDRFATLTGRQDILEEDVANLANTKLDQSAFQSAVDAGFKVIDEPPASAGAVGEPGEVRWDTEYFYVCVETNTWKRIPLSSW